MTRDNEPLDLDTVLALFRRVQSGAPTDPRARLLEDVARSGKMRSEGEMNAAKAALFEAWRSEPPRRCLAPAKPPCGKPPIASHSVQRGVALATIADSSQHVIAFPARLTLDEPKATAKKLGINKASTFVALCGDHDTSIFRPIDTGALSHPTEEQLFLFSYRSMLKELHVVERKYELHKRQARYIASDKGTSKEAQTVAIMTAYTSYLHYHKMEGIKHVYDRALLTKRYTAPFRYFYRRLTTSAFAVGGFFAPAQDFGGSPIPQLGPDYPPPFMTLEVAPDSTGSLVSIGVPLGFETQLKPLVDRLESTTSEDLFLDLVWLLALRCCENIFIAPRAWSVLSIRKKQRIERFFNVTTLGRWAPMTPLAVSLREP